MSVELDDQQIGSLVKAQPTDDNFRQRSLASLHHVISNDLRVFIGKDHRDSHQQEYSFGRFVNAWVQQNIDQGGQLPNFRQVMDGLEMWIKMQFDKNAGILEEAQAFVSLSLYC